MTMQERELTGARVTGADGQVIGTVEQVFNDDVSGKPVWARIRAGKTSRFIPLGGTRMSADGFSVPFDTQKIMSGPDLGVERHMSAAQADELRHHYGLTVPTQAGQTVPTKTDQAALAKTGQAEPAATGQPGPAPTGQTVPAQAGQPDGNGSAGQEWLILVEERLTTAGTEVQESGRVRLRKYVDVEPVEQVLHVFHEEYEVERLPITPGEQVGSPSTDSARELILHAERAVIKKEAVPVERVRLVAKKVQEDRTIRDELRKERIEVEPDSGTRGPGSAEPPEQDQSRRSLGRRRNSA
jgi:stress response protein YsnF/sporulation protein YlmC with PRC-barrel domain